jgi:hypothetical protein
MSRHHGLKQTHSQNGNLSERLNSRTISQTSLSSIPPAGVTRNNEKNSRSAAGAQDDDEENDEDELELGVHVINGGDVNISTK